MSARPGSPKRHSHPSHPRHRRRPNLHTHRSRPNDRTCGPKVAQLALRWPQLARPSLSQRTSSDDHGMNQYGGTVADDVDLATRLMIASSRFVRRVRRTNRMEHSTAEWRTLSIIGQHAPLRVTDLARIDHVSQPTVTVMVNRLVGLGLVERSREPHDRRARQLSLTDQGHTALSALRENATGELAPMIGALSEEERGALDAAADILLRLTAHEGDLTPPGPADPWLSASAGAVE